MKLAEVLKEHPGIRKMLVEDLYPDKAHFIYELLQNAEDQQATLVTFELSAGALRFEHDGTPFRESDIRGITDFGDGTKASREDKIGRFGIGFKAVFNYTNTPRIWSPTYSFEIKDLVVPSALAMDPTIEARTRFEFPFDNPEKPADSAYREVLDGLEQLAEDTLLFLKSIASIRWQVDDGTNGWLRRFDHGDGHIETQKQHGDQILSRAHFLRFERPVEGTDGQRAAVAFALEALPRPEGVPESAPSSGKRYRVVPANPGRVAIYFPAHKEVSGLRFHLHAPFVPELSRASVKDTPANEPLFGCLADLVVESLSAIRDRGLLDADCLGVLPNPRDSLPDRYKIIRDTIITALINQPLTPTQSKAHAPANQLLQSSVALKSLLSDDDLERLVVYEEHPPRWVVNAPQRNSDADQLLSSLGIPDWDVDKFVGALVRSRNSLHWEGGTPRWIFGSAIQEWLSGHTDQWHQRLYALLYRELEPSYKLRRVMNARIVRTGSGDYMEGNQCFFPTDGVEVDPILPRVRLATYTSGRNTAQKDDARRFLEAIGVREVGETEQVEAILDQRYADAPTRINQTTYKRDLKRFVALVEADPGSSKMFAEYHVFRLSDESWGCPHDVYLDAPYMDTGLHAFYSRLGDTAPRQALARSYAKLGIPSAKIAQFAESVGAAVSLQVSHIRCYGNPEWHTNLALAPGSNVTFTGTNRDYTIDGLDEVLEEPDIDVARLIWTSLSELTADGKYLRATFRKSKSYDSRHASSQLVHTLRDAAWIPQNDHGFVRPAEATQELLPSGFPYDSGSTWLQAVGFGEEVALKESERQAQLSVAKQFGIHDAQDFALFKRFQQHSFQEREWVMARLEELSQRRGMELPENEPAHPERRAELVAAEAEHAPERVTEKRTRSVSISRESVKKDTDPYLRMQYTNADDVLVCQMCMSAMPFRLSDGNHYFEAVEFLPDLRLRHYQNYLALCPNHAAMYQYGNDAPELVRRAFDEILENTMELVLAGQEASIFFTRTHLADLRSVIATDAARPDSS